jgi:integrase
MAAIMPKTVIRATLGSPSVCPEGTVQMNRATRYKTGSVVFDKRRKTWNYLWCVDGKRRSKLIGTLQQFPTKGAAQRAAQGMKPPEPKPVVVLTVKALVTQYRTEKMPTRIDTRRCYELWLKNHILPRWQDCVLSDVQARPVEMWLDSLTLSPKSKSHIRGLLYVLWDFAMWCGHVPTQRNPIELVTVKGASKRTRKPRILTVEEYQLFAQQLSEPFRNYCTALCLLRTSYIGMSGVEMG